MEFSHYTIRTPDGETCTEQVPAERSTGFQVAVAGFSPMTRKCDEVAEFEITSKGHDGHLYSLCRRHFQEFIANSRTLKEEIIAELLLARLEAEDRENSPYRKM
jgi:hypothetical protein